MLDKAAIKNKLRSEKAMLDGMGIKSLYLFGSFARGEQKKRSDIDFIVAFHETPDLFRYIGIQRELSEFLGHRVDLATPKGLHPALRSGILKEAELAYGEKLDLSARRYS